MNNTNLICKTDFLQQDMCLKELLEPVILSEKAERMLLFSEKLQEFFPHKETEKDGVIKDMLVDLKQEVKIHLLRQTDNFDKLSKKIMQLHKTLTEGKNPNYNFILQYWPRFMSAFAEAFQDIDLKTLSEKHANFIVVSLDSFIKTTGKLFYHQITDRFLSVELYHNPENSNEICVYDYQLGQALTQYFPYTEKSLDDLSSLVILLREKILNRYKTGFPLQYLEDSFKYYEAYEPLNQHISGCLTFQISYPVTQVPELVSLLNKEIQKTVFTDILVKQENLSPLYALTPIAKHSEITPYPASPDWLKRLERFCAAVIAGGISFTLSMALGPYGVLLSGLTFAILDEIFYNFLELIIAKDEQPGQSALLQEIERLLANAQQEAWYEEIKALFLSFHSAILQRYDNLKNLNKDKDSIYGWSMGKPEDWESIVNEANTLKEYLFSNYFQGQYLASSLFPEFLVYYTRLITGKMQSKAEKNFDVAYELDLLRDCYIRANLFIKKMFDSAWNKSVEYSDFMRIQAYYHAPVIANAPATYAIRDNYNNYHKEFEGGKPEFNNDWSIDEILGVSETKTGSAGYDSLYAGMRWMESRLRIFTVQTSRLTTACQLLENLCKSYNAYMEPTELLPTNYQERYITGNLGIEDLCSRTRQYVCYDLNYSYGGALAHEYGYGILPGAPSSPARVSLRDSFFDLGVYPVVNLEFPKGLWTKIPLGVIVDLYTGENFTGDLISLDYNNPDGPLELKTVKSMKIYFDFYRPGHTYSSYRAGNAFSRLKGSVNGGDVMVKLSDIANMKVIENPWTGPIDS